MLERGKQPRGHVIGLTRAEAALENLLGVLDTAFVDVLERDRALIGFLNDRVALFDRNSRDLGDLEHDAFDFILPQELEDRRREFESQRDQKYRGLFRPRNFDLRMFGQTGERRRLRQPAHSGKINDR